MKKLLILLPLLAVCVLATAKEADIVYAEGYVDIKLESGDRIEAVIGEYVEVGDTVITEEDSRAELESASGAIIRIAPETVFTFREIEQDGENRSVFSTTLGAVGFKLGKLTQKEPIFTTPGAVAGVRGTEFEIFAGSDGSTLVVVDAGSVVVESQGKSVELMPNEAVEVVVGEPPKDKFTVNRDLLDFSTWNSQKQAAILQDPAAAIAGVERGLADFGRAIGELLPRYEDRAARLEQERAKVKAMEKNAQKDYYTKVVFPLEVETTYLRLNLRYYALSALSFRRYVLGGIYVSVKTQFINALDDPAFLAFSETYRRVRAVFDADIQPLLVEADF